MSDTDSTNIGPNIKVLVGNDGEDYLEGTMVSPDDSKDQQTIKINGIKDDYNNHHIYVIKDEAEKHEPSGFQKDDNVIGQLENKTDESEQKWCGKLVSLITAEPYKNADSAAPTGPTIFIKISGQQCESGDNLAGPKERVFHQDRAYVMKPINAGEKVLYEIKASAEINEGEIKEGEIKEGEIKEGEIKEGEIKEGEIKEGEIKEGGTESISDPFEENVNIKEVGDPIPKDDVYKITGNLNSYVTFIKGKEGEYTLDDEKTGTIVEIYEATRVRYRIQDDSKVVFFKIKIKADSGEIEIIKRAPTLSTPSTPSTPPTPPITTGAAATALNPLLVKFIEYEKEETEGALVPGAFIAIIFEVLSELQEDETLRGLRQTFVKQCGKYDDTIFSTLYQIAEYINKLPDTKPEDINKIIKKFDDAKAEHKQTKQMAAPGPTPGPAPGPTPGPAPGPVPVAQIKGVGIPVEDIAPGIKNKDTDCFQIASLQMLYCIPEFRNFVKDSDLATLNKIHAVDSKETLPYPRRDGKSEQRLATTEYNNIQNYTKTLFTEMFKNRGISGKVLDTQTIKDLGVSTCRPSDTRSSQEDANEATQRIFSAFFTLPALSPENENIRKKLIFLKNFMKGVQVKEFYCYKDHMRIEDTAEISANDTDLLVSVELADGNNKGKAFPENTKLQYLIGEQHLFKSDHGAVIDTIAPRCVRYNDVSGNLIEFTRSYPSKYLGIHLQRFTGGREKNKAKIVGLDRLEWKCYNATFKYVAIATVVHLGSIGSGHYVAYVRTNTGEIYCMNDSRVTKETYTSFDQIYEIDGHPYIVLYQLEKVEPDGSSPVVKEERFNFIKVNMIDAVIKQLGMKGNADINKWVTDLNTLTISNLYELYNAGLVLNDKANIDKSVKDTTLKSLLALLENAFFEDSVAPLVATNGEAISAPSVIGGRQKKYKKINKTLKSRRGARHSRRNRKSASNK